MIKFGKNSELFPNFNFSSRQILDHHFGFVLGNALARTVSHVPTSVDTNEHDGNALVSLLSSVEAPKLPEIQERTLSPAAEVVEERNQQQEGGLGLSDDDEAAQIPPITTSQRGPASQNVVETPTADPVSRVCFQIQFECFTFVHSSSDI